ncbi:hypothetical protein [Polycladomyces subterraneus]|jgi:hypothetical protein|uniref:Uncharacterized protein n=1 Tax=Polycladomyces subterraneus TaxID=1016997 RepID=A0ABT8IKW9_9BACL|nr:hypothetical protein [Polycladomyces subterraneus]MDN4593396.1 hypothetical protein [Polycladomyces subterraneus]
MNKQPEAGLFQPEKVFIGGYSEEERRPDPFVAVSFADERSAKAAYVRLKEGEKDWRIRIESSGENVRVVLEQEGASPLYVEDIWKDETWHFFSSYYHQSTCVLLMMAVEEEVRPDWSIRLAKEQVRVE